MPKRKEKFFLSYEKAGSEQSITSRNKVRVIEQYERKEWKRVREFKKSEKRRTNDESGWSG